MRKIASFFSVLIILFISACTENVEIISYEVDYTKTGNIVANQSQWNDFLVRIDFNDGTYVEFFLNESLIDIDDRNKINIAGKHNINLRYQQFSLSFELEVFRISYETQLRQIYQMSLEADAFIGTYEEWLESIKGPTGADGREVLFQVSEGYIQWQYEGETTWTNLIAMDTLVGASGEDGVDGREVLFQVSEGYIQWQYEGETTWTNLVAMDTLVGASGEDGVDGREVLFQVSEGYIQWQYEGETTWTNLIAMDTLVGVSGEDGVDGREVLFQVSEGYIQWQYEGETTWTNLIKVSDLLGQSGNDGQTPYIGENGNWWIGNEDLGVFAGYVNLGIQPTGEFEFAINSDGQSYYIVEYTGIDRFVSIPNYFQGYPVSGIGENSFKNNLTLEKIFIPSNIKTIEASSFYGNINLKEVEFDSDSSLQIIGDYAFSEATSLTSLTIPGSVTTIGRGIFVDARNLEAIFNDSRFSYLDLGIGVRSRRFSVPAVAFDQEGDIIVVGSPGAFVNGSSSGSVDIYKISDPTYERKITPSDGGTNGYFGNALSISGDIIVVGSPGDDDKGSNIGSVYIYKISDPTYERKITPSDGVYNDYFGNALSISGDIIVVGSPGAVVNGNIDGSVYIYKISDPTYERKITPSDAGTNDYFGKALSISGDIIVVGSPYDDDNGSSSGSVYIYKISDPTYERKITPSDGEANDFFGSALSISGDIIVVGKPYDDDNGSSSGSVYIYKISDPTYERKITPSDGEVSDVFGNSVSISGDIIVVGSPYDDDNGSNSGSVYIYDISKESNEFGFEIKLNYFNGISGLIISISENIIILKSSSLSTKFYLIEI